MRLHLVLTENKMARSRSEAERLIKEGAVMVGGCKPECGFFTTGKCDCGGWAKATDPTAEVTDTRVKVGTRTFRLVTRRGGTGVDMLKAITTVTEEGKTTMDTKQLSALLRLAAVDLPEKFSLYEVAEQVIFPIYGVTNSPSISIVAFIVRRGEGVPPDNGVFPSPSGGADFLNKNKGDWVGAPLRFGTLTELPSRGDISAMFTLAVAACNDLHQTYQQP